MGVGDYMFVILIRHAERLSTQGDPDPSLSPAGRDRANLLASMLSETGFDAIFTSEFKRTKETASPLAARTLVVPTTLSTDMASAVTQVRSAGQRVLVIGHSNTVPELIAGLNGPTHVVIDDDEFNRMFMLDVLSHAGHLLSMKYGAI